MTFIEAKSNIISNPPWSNVKNCVTHSKDSMLFYLISTPCSQTGHQNCIQNIQGPEMNLQTRGSNGASTLIDS